jgi:ParB/RepB/Spo0J family partition protein
MEQKILDLRLEQICEPPQAMRTEIPRDAIFELAQDIKQNGLINPITVRPMPYSGSRGACPDYAANGKCAHQHTMIYEIVAGHRRFLAHRYGGIATIRCIVRELSDDEAFAIMTSENLARENVNPVDEAIHTMRLLEHCGGDVEKARAIMNRSRNWIEDRVTIAQMYPELQQALREGKIKIGAALALTKITDETDQRACLGMAISQGASVTIVNYWVAQWHAGIFGHANSVTVPDSDLPERERQVITLKCAIDGKDYPCEEFVSIMVARKNLGYVQAINEHLKQTESEPTKDELAAHALDAAYMEDDDGNDAATGAANAQEGRTMLAGTTEE